MPVFLIMLLVLGGVYQLFFRYEHWVDTQNSRLVYERDNLTGETHIIKPGEKINVFSRLIGEGRNPKADGPFSMSLIEEPEPADGSAQKTVTGKITGAAIPPEPVSAPPHHSPGRELPIAERTNGPDLNGDGTPEQILMNRTADDGLLDISILEGHREMFYGRGRRIEILEEKAAGWSDIALVTHSGDRLVFRYSPAIAGYEVKQQE